jgi:hypothetical protein
MQCEKMDEDRLKELLATAVRLGRAMERGAA